MTIDSKNILIIGGNRFFGKRLTQKLLGQGHNITLINRGNLDDGLGNDINRIKCDRTDYEKMSELLKDSSWDVVYDQVCFDYTDAKQACQIFSGKTKNYIYTSSVSVYENGPNLTEADFSANDHTFDKLETKDSDYAEAKRQAEVSFERYANFPVTSLRFPVVVGLDDYTERFKFHLDRIKNQDPIYFPDLEARKSFISSESAADVLVALSEKPISGPINAASSKSITLKRFIELIEEQATKKVNLAPSPEEKTHSPYGISSDWFIKSDLKNKIGIELPEIEDWLPEMISQYYSRCDSAIN